MIRVAHERRMKPRITVITLGVGDPPCHFQKVNGRSWEVAWTPEWTAMR
jgi:hypothetical protein